MVDDNNFDLTKEWLKSHPDLAALLALQPRNGDSEDLLLRLAVARACVDRVGHKRANKAILYALGQRPAALEAATDLVVSHPAAKSVKTRVGARTKYDFAKFDNDLKAFQLANPDLQRKALIGQLVDWYWQAACPKRSANGDAAPRRISFAAKRYIKEFLDRK
jgi:hypothetical protein